jgi:alpha-N-arabinofuranosidase
MRIFAVSIALIATLNVTSAETVVTLDTSRTGEPISPYIYGQFIEHLGRSIYGGLWSEMLEDRKFFYAVTGDAPPWEMFEPGPEWWAGEGHPYELLMRSPWLILGDRQNVTMNSEVPYVGEHAPQIELDNGPGGIVQERLALVEGKTYTGRIVLAGDPEAAPIAISLVWGGGASDRDTVVVPELSRSYQTLPLRFHSKGSTDNGRLEIVGRGRAGFRIGAVSLMPADHIYGWRADTVALLKELNAPVYRWPGGNFVSGYNWKDGIGDPDRRPPRKNPAWKGIEPNDVGIHEYMDLCREIGAEPFIAVNTGLGDEAAAAEQVEYVNGSPESRKGRLRAQNGHLQPFGVKWWAIGNEMYGDWQLGVMPLDRYLLKHRSVVEAMRAVDPSIEPVAVGHVGDWSRRMLESNADTTSLISEHLYWEDEENLIDHVRQIPDGIRRIADAHRAYRAELSSLSGKDIRIALDEWNYWYGANEYGELGVRYYLQDALGIAAGLHELFRSSDLFFVANYAQTVNVIGAIKTTKSAAELEPTGLVLKLYRHHFGRVPIEVSGVTPPLDVSAAWSEDQATVTIAVVNPTEETKTLKLEAVGTTLSGKGQRWTLSGKHRWAHNQPGRPRGVDITRETLREQGNQIAVAPLSVTLYSLEVGR